jgi:hypothetical protein
MQDMPQFETERKRLSGLPSSKLALGFGPLFSGSAVNYDCYHRANAAEAQCMRERNPGKEPPAVYTGAAAECVENTKAFLQHGVDNQLFQSNMIRQDVLSMLQVWQLHPAQLCCCCWSAGACGC